MQVLVLLRLFLGFYVSFNFQICSILAQSSLTTRPLLSAPSFRLDPCLDRIAMDIVGQVFCGDRSKLDMLIGAPPQSEDDDIQVISDRRVQASHAYWTPIGHIVST